MCVQTVGPASLPDAWKVSSKLREINTALERHLNKPDLSLRKTCSSALEHFKEACTTWQDSWKLGQLLPAGITSTFGVHFDVIVLSQLLRRFLAVLACIAAWVCKDVLNGLYKRAQGKMFRDTEATDGLVQQIDWSELQLQEPAIAAGAFKTVHRARWHNRDVAVLRLRRGDITTEAAVFTRLGRHRHLTRLLCMSRDDNGVQALVTEFAQLGSLQDLLHRLEDAGRKADNAVLVRVAMQVCEGMAQIAEEGMMHRDLAARNILVFSFDAGDAQMTLVKITDYGYRTPIPHESAQTDWGR